MNLIVKNFYRLIPNVKLHWLWLFAALVSIPWACRLAVLSDRKTSLAVADLAGFSADLAVTIPLFFLVYFLRSLTALLALIPLVFWCVLSQANFEHVAANGEFINFRYFHHIFSPTFFNGSALVVSSWFLVGFLLIISFGALVFKYRSLNFQSTFFLLLLTVLSCCAPILKSSLLIPQWRASNILFAVIHDNLRQTPATGQPGAVSYGWYGEQQKPDLSGAPYHLSGLKKPNILILVLEGVTGGLLPSFRTIQGVKWDVSLPGLDSIAQEHIRFPNFISHQRQTNRGLFTLLTGAYPKLNSSTPKMTEYITWPKIHTLPKHLSENGYHTIYMQASPLAYMLKDIFMSKAGFSKVMGRSHFNKHYSQQYWGIDDKAFFEQAAEHLARYQQSAGPWFATMLTVGTHHPLNNVPATFRILKNETSKQRVYAYLDGALKQFLRTLKDGGILNNTLVLITCDEAQSVKGSYSMADRKWSQQWGIMVAVTPENRAYAQHQIFSQRDVALSVLDYIKMSGSAHPFGGRSLFRSYNTSRDIFFANTYGRVAGRITKGAVMEICRETFSRCESYRLDPQRVFSTARHYTGELPKETCNALAGFAHINNLSLKGMDTASKVTMDFFSGRTHTIKIGKQYNLLAGQFFSLPKNSEVRVSLKGRVLACNSGTVFIKHDLYGKALHQKIVKYVHKHVNKEEQFHTAYQFYNLRRFDHSEFRVTAQVFNGKVARVIVDEAILSYYRRKASQNELALAGQPYHPKVGRDLGAKLKSFPINNKARLAKQQP